MLSRAVVLFLRTQLGRHMELDLNHVTVNGTGNSPPHNCNFIIINNGFSVVSTQIAFTPSEALLKVTGSAESDAVACVGQYRLASCHVTACCLLLLQLSCLV